MSGLPIPAHPGAGAWPCALAWPGNTGAMLRKVNWLARSLGFAADALITFLFRRSAEPCRARSPPSV